MIAEVSAIIPTVGRRERLARTIGSVLRQDVLPAEIIIVDGSAEPLNREGLESLLGEEGFGTSTRFTVVAAERRGAGPQRNQGLALSSQPLIWFLDDDIDLEPGCLAALSKAMADHDRLGGCNALITNQQYHPPGSAMRRLLSLAGCPRGGSLAGHCYGPALAFLPSSDSLAQDDAVDWLNTTCTLYRRSAMPSPAFLPYFEGYSLMEDAALSLEVGKRWLLKTIPGARIYHDTQPAGYKSRTIARQAMEVTNRWFVAHKILKRPGGGLAGSMVLLQLISLAGLVARPAGWGTIPGWLAGTFKGAWRVALHGHSWRAYESSPSPL